MMEITYTISTDCTGKNTAVENDRYKNALWNELSTNYPCADITVKVTNEPNYTRPAYVSDDITGEIAEDIEWIANDVWGKADY